MTPQLLRLAYAVEFLVALVAIFTAWSEIGGQAVLDLMHWGWKLGLSLILATAIVGFSAAVTAEEKLWTFRSARWFAALLVCVLAMAAVTYYYSLQTDNGEPDDTGHVSVISPAVCLSPRLL
jgi:drug/metabolite transporter (DMT)-like permease